ncbi:MAG: hypothetical protein AAB526_03400 [Patescibacteria group bacterium]
MNIKKITGIAMVAMFALAITMPVVAAETISDGSLIKVASDAKVYLVTGNKIGHIVSPRVSSSYGSYKNIKVVASLAEYEVGEVVTKVMNGTLVQSATDTTVYVVTDGKKQHITGMTAFKGLGYQIKNIIKLIAAQMALYTEGNAITTTSTHPEGSLVKSTDGKIYVVEAGKKRAISGPTAFRLNNFLEKNILVIPVATMAKYADGEVVSGKIVAKVEETKKEEVKSGLTVALAATTPVSVSIINSQATAGLLDVTFTGTGTVNSVTLKRSGNSGQNTLTNVYLYDGVTRLTDGYSFNNNGEIVMNNLNLAVSGSKTVSVKADVSSTATANASSIAIALTSFSSGTTVNTVNVVGNTMTIAVGDLATASFAPNTVAATSVNAGVSAYTFWSAPIQVNTRALTLKSVAFRMIGSAPSDALSNIKLTIDSVDTTKVGVVTNIQGTTYVVFDLTGAAQTLSTGSHTLDVRAKIDKGSSRTVQLSLQQAADLMITDPQAGVNVAVSGIMPNNAGTITINAGSLSASIDSTFNAMTTTVGGASNVAIAKYKVHAYGENVKISSIQVLPVLTGTTPAAAGLDNVTLYYNGSQITQQDWTSGALTFSLGSQVIVDAGTDGIIEIRSDIKTNAAVNYTAGDVSVNLVVGTSNAQGESSFTLINTPAVAGNALTVQIGNLATSKNTSYANQNVNANTVGVKIGSFRMQNQSSSESVRITNLRVDLSGTAALTNFTNLKISEVADPIQPQIANNFSVDFTLAPAANKTIDVFADTGVAITGNIVSALTVSSRGVTSGVIATSAVITGQTATLAVGTIGTIPTATSSSTVAQLIAAANGGALDATKAVYNFTSTGAASTITELKFAVTGEGTVDKVKVGSVEAFINTGIAYLTGLNLLVPVGGDGLNQEVSVSYTTVGEGGIASTTNSAITLTYVKYTSGNTTTAFVPSVVAPTMILVGSKPEFTVIDSAETLINGLVKIAEITVKADAKGSIKIGKLPISVTSTGVAAVATGANNIIVKDTSEVVVPTTNTGLAVAAGGTGVDTIIFGTTTATSYSVAAGASKTFRIYTTPSLVGGAVGTTSLSTKLGVNTLVEWYDVAGNNAALINASKVFNYPTNTSVITN